MRIFILFCLILFALTISCQNRGNKSGSKRILDSIVTHNPDSAAFNFKPDTSGMATDIYAVYELSPQTTAFVINFFEEGQQKTFVDSIFDQVSTVDSIYNYSNWGPKNSSYYDTLGPYRLIKSEKFEKRLKPYFDREYYIYGTLGVAKTTITNIVLGIDPCKTNIFAFCIDKSKIEKIGHPLICTRTLFNLKIGTYRNWKGYFSRLDSMDRKENDYADTISTRVFGQADSLCFTFKDDFMWLRKEGKSKCLFPYRSLFVTDKKGNLSLYWGDGLDLFGIECD